VTPRLRFFASTASFTLALGFMCSALRPFLPIPPVPVVRTKLLHLREDADAYDTLFVGSSRIFHQIVPSRFEHHAAVRGMSVRSFNLGLDGMRPPEDGYLLDQVLARKPQRLRWVFVEIGSIRLVLGEERRNSLRAQYWHDYERVALLMQNATTPAKKRSFRARVRVLFESRKDVLAHLGLFGQRFLNLGRGASLVGRMLTGRPEGVSHSALGPRRDGFVPDRRTQISEPARVEHEQDLAERLRTPAERDYADPASQQALERMLGKIEQAGARPVLLIAPTPARRNFHPNGPRGRNALLLDFSDPRKYPALFESRHRLDADHLNVAGAEIFTQLVAEEWAAAVLRDPW